MSALPRLIESFVVQTDSYECDEGEFAHRSAAIVAASSTAALPVSVVRKSRTGAARLRAQAVLPVKGVACGRPPVAAVEASKGRFTVPG